MKNIVILNAVGAFTGVPETFEGEDLSLLAVVDNGRDCLDYIESGKVDIVIMDLDLPVTDDGRGVTDMVNAMPPERRPKVFIMPNVAYSMIHNITKWLYPIVAKNHAATSDKAERAICHAIELAWARGKEKNSNILLGGNMRGAKVYDSGNKQVVAMLDKLMLEAYKRNRARKLL